MPAAPEPENHEWPCRPEPSIVPSSSSTESTIPESCGPIRDPAEAVAPATRVSLSKSSKKKLTPTFERSNGRSAFFT